MSADAKLLEELCQRLIGKDQDDAVVAIELAGLRSRTIKIDGQGLMVTNDFKMNRINLHIRNGKVERAHVG